MHVVADGDDGALRAGKLRLDPSGDVFPERVVEPGLVVGETLATQLTPGRDGPDIRDHPVVVLEQLLGLECPGHADTGGEDLGAAGVLTDPVEGAGAQQVHALQDSLNIHVLRFGGLHVGLVVDGEVVHDVLGLLPIHPVQAVADDVRKLISVGGIVGGEGSVGGGQDRRVAVHVLRALTRQGSATGGGPDHESPGELVTGSPHGVAGALEAEHRVEHVDRNHGFAMGGVGGPGGGEGRHRTGLVDAGVEDLAVGGLPVAEEQVRVDGRVLLAARVVDLDGREEGVDTEGTSLVGDDGHHARCERLVAHQVLEQAHEGHGGGHLLLAGTLADGFIGLLPRQRDELAVPTTFRHVAAERAATFLQVLHPRVLRPGFHVWRAVGIGLEHGVGDRHMNPVAERLEIVEGHLLHLVSGVAARKVLT